ncbi:hypothetical protein AMC99_01831 [Altererythrobacter epoxidivorans]|uniref:Uncharacterized protein n=1 Tax=Altererythrobacter epoxidivorans TaxID=361183 RepID=A0A0M5L761_9SPHN|nr:hypothetical protein AMC99_01831 [Altererythrobacter epoxidivorans]
MRACVARVIADDASKSSHLRNGLPIKHQFATLRLAIKHHVFLPFCPINLPPQHFLA